MSAAPGFPADAADIHEEEGRVSLIVDAELYPRDVVYVAVMPLLATAFVGLDRVGPSIRIDVRPRAQGEVLRAVLGRLANELLVAASRAEIAKRRGGVLEAVTRRAISGAMGPPNLEDLESFDLDDDALYDPLGIAQSWDQAHAKDKEDG